MEFYQTTLLSFSLDTKFLYMVLQLENCDPPQYVGSGGALYTMFENHVRSWPFP